MTTQVLDGIENAHIGELTAQRDTLLAQLQECQNFIRAFPGRITSARLDAKQGVDTKYDYYTHARCLETRVPLKDSREELIARLTETDALAIELMERAERIDEKLIKANGGTRDCELGEITRMRGQLSKNRVTIQKGQP